MQIANTYLERAIGITLEQVAKQALEYYENTNKEKGIATKK
ncbi:hypothetical protein [Cardinium endosymbiont of Sogatella furcifera]|nr:hypothetical protein [Cardinium endosymbiont of Sogatella furcifera]